METTEKKQKKEAARVIEWEEKITELTEAYKLLGSDKFAVELEQDSSLLAEKRLQEDLDKVKKLKGELEADNLNLTQEIEEKDALIEDQQSEIRELKKILKGS